MALSNDLASLFAKVTKDETETKKESTAYGKIVKQGDTEYVQLDGSDLLTPISSTTVVNDGDRVMVTIKNHTAIVTGDLTNPSANNKDVVEIGNKISEFEIIIADKVTTEQLEAEIARIDKLISDDIEATNAKFETIEGKVAEIDTIKADVIEVEGKIEAQEGEFTTLRADIADFKDVTAEEIEAIEGKFNTLSSDYADFEVTVTNRLTANEGSIADLETNKLDAETADLKYANIDFTNIGSAAIEEFFSKSGMIDNLVVGEGTITGTLVGVTIIGDLIEGGTVKADKLVVLGEDGLYYKLNTNGETVTTEQTEYNSLNGSIITAKSITADRIDVNDLVAFGATIGGFKITDSALYSGVKESVDNETTGIYLDDEGQLIVGDETGFIKYYKDENDNYVLKISAKSILLGTEERNIEDAIATVEKLEISNNNLEASVIEITDDIGRLTESVNTKVSSSDLSIIVKNELENAEVSKVVTSTGFVFDSNGLTISKSGKEMSTNIDEDGVSIYRDTEEVLTADSQGVNAYNLHAKTYLIIGDTSRFEDFIKNDKKRTGCFWIG